MHSNEKIIFEKASFKYKGRAAPSLQNINCEIKQGEFIVLIGGSGCGKTTMTRCVNNLIPHFYEGELEGKVFVLGNDIANTEVGVTGQKVSSVFQDPRTQFFTTNSVAEVAFACENYGLPAADMRRRVDRAFQQMHIRDLREKNVFQLSSGERQKIAFAASWTLSPFVFVLDEPSANLDIESIFHIRDILKELKAAGHTIIVSEHRLFYMKELADSYWLINNGELVRRISPAEMERLPEEELGNHNLRQIEIGKVTWHAESSIKRQIQTNCFLEVKKLSFGFKGAKSLFENISFTAQGGEIICLTGANGCGKTTLGKLLSGLLRGAKKAISINGIVQDRRHLSKQVYFVMQETDHQLYTDSVDKELLLGSKAEPSKIQRMREGLSAINMTEYSKAHPCSLSGGQKQRITILAALLSDKPILILDEPTSGLDYVNMKAVVSLIRQTAEQGRLVLVISHDLEFLSHVCTRAVCLGENRIKQDFQVRSDEDFQRLKDCMMAARKGAEKHGEEWE